MKNNDNYEQAICTIQDGELKQLKEFFTRPFHSQIPDTPSTRLDMLREVEKRILEYTSFPDLSELQSFIDTQKRGDDYKSTLFDKKANLATLFLYKLQKAKKQLRNAEKQERLLRCYLHAYQNCGGVVIHNLLLEVDNCLTEIDSLLILPQGIYIFDSKFRSKPDDVSLELAKVLERQRTNIMKTVLSSRIGSRPCISFAVNNIARPAIFSNNMNGDAVLCSEEEIVKYVEDNNPGANLSDADIDTIALLLENRMKTIPLSKHGAYYDTYSFERGAKDFALSWLFIAQKKNVDCEEDATNQNSIENPMMQAEPVFSETEAQEKNVDLADERRKIFLTNPDFWKGALKVTRVTLGLASVVGTIVMATRGIPTVPTTKI